MACSIMSAAHDEYFGSLSEDIMIKICAFLDLNCCCRLRLNSNFRKLIDTGVLNKMSHVQGNQIRNSEGCTSLIPHLVSMVSLVIPSCPWLCDLHLKDIARNCCCLNTVDFSGCQLISDDGIAALAAGCRDLRAVDLTFCFRTTYESVLTLLDVCGSDVVVKTIIGSLI
jgi:hypothetical protein